ncbi:hypothetical protein VTJ04DRAFT_6762 [Mycothermus thermophilus]|uniref:uncharacterized protein n=1 Tax=Humicola insolens TaxID=85995 RepID=UPI003743363F
MTNGTFLIRRGGKHEFVWLCTGVSASCVYFACGPRNLPTRTRHEAIGVPRTALPGRQGDRGGPTPTKKTPMPPQGAAGLWLQSAVFGRPG